MTDQPTRPAHAALRAFASPIPYPVTYQRELSPAWLRYAAAINGYRCAPLDGPFEYLELGCGRGLSTVIHAAAFPAGRFHACDADGRAIAWGRRHARALGVDNAAFRHATFDGLLRHDGLPEFDFIAVHGVYSWVDQAARSAIRRLLARLLAPRGVVCVSYNCMPGWAAEVPLRRMLRELAATVDDDPGRRARTAALALDALAGSGAAYFQASPAAAAAVAAYLTSSGDYLAHELLGPEFEPFYSVDVAGEMADSDLRLLGSATLVDNYPSLLLGEAAARAVTGLSTDRQRQLALDLAVNRRFRRDLFVRARTAPPRGDAFSVEELPVGCAAHPATLPATMIVPRGRFTFDAAFTEAVDAALSDSPRPLGPLADLLSSAPASPQARQAVLRNLLYLTAGGLLTPCVRQTAAAGNAWTFPADVVRRAVSQAAGAGNGGWIPSQVTGAGIEMSRQEARLVLNHAAGTPRALPAAEIRRLMRLGILNRRSEPIPPERR